MCLLYRDIYIYMYVYIYIHIYTYIHTYIERERLHISIEPVQGARDALPWVDSKSAVMCVYIYI